MNHRLVLVVAAAALAFIAGCGEPEQTALYKDVNYRGKPDTRPWDNPPPEGSAQWKQGDHASWENQVRTRGAAQNENRRSGH